MAQKEFVTSKGQHIIADVGNIEKYMTELKHAGFKPPTVVPPSDTFAIRLASETPYQSLVDHISKSIIANPYSGLNAQRSVSNGRPVFAISDGMPVQMFRGNFSDAIIPGNADLIAYKPDIAGGDMMGSRAAFVYPDRTGGNAYLGSSEQYLEGKIRAINNYIEAGNSNMGFLDEEFRKIGIDPYSTSEIDFDKMPDGAKRLRRFMELTGWKEGLKFQDRFLKQQAANTQAQLDLVNKPSSERSIAFQKKMPKDLRRYMLELRDDLMRGLRGPVSEAHLTPSALAGIELDPLASERTGMNPAEMSNLGTEIIDMDAVRDDVKARMKGNPTAVELGKLMDAAEKLKVRFGLPPAHEMLGAGGRFFGAVAPTSDVLNARLLTQVEGAGLDLNTGSLNYPSEMATLDSTPVIKEALDYASKFHPDNASNYPGVSHEMRWKFYSKNAPSQNPYKSEMEARILDGYEQNDYKTKPLPFQNVTPAPLEAVIGSDSSNFDEMLGSLAAY